MKDEDVIMIDPSRIQERLIRKPIQLWYYCRVILPLTSYRPTQRKLFVLMIIHLLILELLAGAAVMILFVL